MVRSILNTIPPLVHILAGLLTPAWVYAYTDTPSDWRVYLACIFFALLPDIDSSSSVIGYAFPFISNPLERRFGHRQITHSLLALAFVGGVGYLLFPADWLLLTSAYASHLFIDMLTGTVGIPLLWPFQISFYLAQIRPKSVGELILGIVVGILLLMPQAPIVTASIESIAPQEEITFYPSPTPHTVTIVIDNVYDADAEILISAGDSIQQGDLIADLTTHRRLTAIQPTDTPTATPTQTPTSLPTATHTPRPPATPDPFEIAAAEQDLELARSIYHRAVATGTPNPIYVATLASFPPQIADRENCIEREGFHSDVGWRCRQELDQLLQQQARIADLAAPWQPDPLDVQVAYQRYEDAIIVYEQRMAQLTLRPTNTPAPTLTPLPTHTPPPLPTQSATADPTATLPAEDLTRIRSLVTGRVLFVDIARITDNSATVEIVVQIESPALLETEIEVFDRRNTKNLELAPLNPLISVQLDRVIDGDTIRVNFADGRQETIRLLDIDTPETKHPTEPIQCYGPEATQFVEQTLCGRPAGQACTAQIFIEPDTVQQRDRYERLLAHIWYQQGGGEPTNLNAQLLTQGFAEFNTYGNPGHYAGQYQQLAAEAQQQDIGLWREC